ncbi:MAG TPA: metallophosphoesterase [Blastocatellia bacterium]|nr:metallophosphoesterase [Blastocatellia bacterium]
MPEFHAEPYLYLAGLTHKAALISWGGFYFRVRDRGEGIDWKLVDDSDLDHVHPPRRETIGARSEPFGKALVQVFKASGELAAFAETMTTNHAWVTGLEPNTEYTYRVTVNGEEWAAGERRDWIVTGQGQGLVKSGRAYDNRFRTHPHPDEAADVTFAVLGDFGTGIRHPSKADRRQREIAAALERAVDERGVQLLLTTGDNIYAGRSLIGIPVGATGDEDDDWFFTFYQPYRYIINRIPVYPSVGNHDSDETEASDDRQQLLDNFFLNERFTGEQTAGRASIGPGLFYRFRYGSRVEFVCIDTSRQSWLFSKRYFEHPNHAAFLEAAFPEKASGSAPEWLIPFTHHPPYCAGPRHSNSSSMIERLVPFFKRAGVRAVFSGHEHNFQYSRADERGYFITGAGGKIRMNPPDGFVEAHTEAWASAGNFLVVEVKGQEMRVTPFGELDGAGNLKELVILNPAGDAVETPIIIA